MIDPRREAAAEERDRTPGVPPRQPELDEDGRDETDEASEESFPSSDPPATGSPSTVAEAE